MQWFDCPVLVFYMLVTVSIRVRRELVELADKMVSLGIARSRSHAFNLMIERGLERVKEEVYFWESVYNDLEKLESSRYRIRHGKLSELLEEGRER